MSSWSDKFEKRLNALTDAASKESIQTLAKWMGFNRKHAEEFAKILATKISTANAARQLVHWQVVHEVLIQEKDSPKWDRLEGLRVTLGEKVVVPLYDKATEGALVGKLKLMLAEWDEVNVFGGPTLINQVRRKISNSKARKETKTSSETETPSTAKKPETEPTRVSVETTAEPKDEEATSTAEEKPTPVEKETTKPSSHGKSAKPKLLRRQSTIEEINFDFEAQGIPAGKVEAREFLEPCKAIATLQIARDLRSDATVRLPSLLSSIPQEILEKCDELQKLKEETGEAPEIPDEVVSKLSLDLKSDVLDLNIEEMLENLTTLREIVQKMRTARKRLAHLLIRSRCQFGARETADAFYSLDSKGKMLQKRKELLSDAMDLEGLDFEEEPSQGINATNDDKSPEVFSWYKGPDEPAAKRSKTQ